MPDTQSIHIVPSAQGEWSVKTGSEESLEIFPSEGLALARAWDLVRDQVAAEVIIHLATRTVRLNLTTELPHPLEQMRYVYENAEDEALCRKAEQLMLNRANLQELMSRLPVSEIDYSQEDDELPC